MKEKLLTTREVSQIFRLSEQEVINLAHAGVLPSFKVGGEFLRFRKEDLAAVKTKIRKKRNLPSGSVYKLEKLREFFCFNDFYILSSIAIIILLWIIFKNTFL